MTAPAAPPPKQFKGECPKCDKVAMHEEFSRDRRAARSPQAAARGDFKEMTEFAFKCAACGGRSDKVMDEQGYLHKWQGHKHVMWKVD